MNLEPKVVEEIKELVRQLDRKLDEMIARLDKKTEG